MSGRTLGLVLAALVGGAAARAGQPPSPEFLLAAFADNQQRFRSGVVRMDGTYLRRSSGIDSPVSLFCAFDTDAKLFRFDRDEPMRPKPKYIDGKVVIKREPEPGGGKYARTPARLIGWDRQDPQSVRLFPLQLTVEQAAFTVKPFDPRILGMANGTTVYHNHPPDQLIADFQKRITAPGVMTTEVRPGVVRLHLPGKWFDQEIDFDKAVGYMPVQYTDALRPKDGLPAEPHVTAATTWKARGGVYVPVTARFQDGSDDSPSLTRYDLKLNWEVVNGPVDEALLTVHGLGLPAETRVIDGTKGETGVTLGKLGDPAAFLKIDAVQGVPPAPPAPPPRSFLWLWVAGGVVALVALAAASGRFRPR